jgi:phosphodiesterase/alkaline phosphatase D-like protein
MPNNLSAARSTRYNQYNSDVDTRAMRASAPLIPVWDDHEFAK